MLFSSITFLFMFLPIVMAVYYLVPNGAKNIVLLLASLFFYAWGEPVYVVLMILSIVLNYFCGRDIEANADNPKKAKLSLVFALTANILILGFFKYYGFLLDTVNSFLTTDIPYRVLPLPIGISFYTFQAISYVIDIYRKDAKPQKNILYFALYISMFPQLIAGPIVRYADIEEQLKMRKVTLRKLGQGSMYFIIGLAKKVIIANSTGAVFENFAHPYVSKSATEFWRRWHISLGTWFREYVYIPLGGNRCSVSRNIFNLMVVWTLTGMWHGAAWNFVAWGVYYGVILVMEKYVWGASVEQLPKPVQHIYAGAVILVGWVFFFSPSLGYALRYLWAMIGGGSGIADAQGAFLLFTHWLLFVIAAVGSTAYGRKLLNNAVRFSANRTVRMTVGAVLYIGIFFLSVAFLVTDTFNPFLYFRF